MNIPNSKCRFSQHNFVQQDNVYLLQQTQDLQHYFTVSKFIPRKLELDFTGISSPFASFKAWKYEIADEFIDLIP